METLPSSVATIFCSFYENVKMQIPFIRVQVLFFFWFGRDFHLTAMAEYTDQMHCFQRAASFERLILKNCKIWSYVTLRGKCHKNGNALKDLEDKTTSINESRSFIIFYKNIFKGVVRAQSNIPEEALSGKSKKRHLLECLTDF